VTGSLAWQKHAGRGIGSIGYLVERLTMKVPDVIISNSGHTTHRLRRAGVKKTIRTVALGVSLDEIYAAKTSPKSSDVFLRRPPAAPQECRYAHPRHRYRPRHQARHWVPDRRKWPRKATLAAIGEGTQSRR